MHRTAVSLTALALAGLGSVVATPVAHAAPAVYPVVDQPYDQFTVSGTKVAGTTSPADAPQLAVGQYVDDIPVAPSTRYYRVERSPGTNLHITFNSRPAANSTEYNKEDWSYELQRLDGRSCDTETGGRSDHQSAQNWLVGAGLWIGRDDISCGKETDLVLAVKRTVGGQNLAATEMRIIEEHPVANADSLPEPVAAMPPVLRPPLAAPTEVVPGHGLSDAATVGNGTHVTKIRPGEIAFFKTKVDYGQNVTFAVDGPTEQFTAWPDAYASMYITSAAWNPLRWIVGSDKETAYRKTALADDQVFAFPTVTYRNRSSADRDVQGHATGGEYTFAIEVSRSGALKGYTEPVPVKFSVKVDGTPVAGPQYLQGVAQPTSGSATATPTASAAPPDTGSTPSAAPTSEATSTAATEATSASAGSSVPVGVWAGLGLAGLGVLGTLAYLITRRLTAPRA